MSSFQFKYFSIQQSRAALKVGTDAMLLGSLCSWENPKRLLDIGTGTGVLSLMCAQRFSFEEIIAIELDHQALLDAKKNAAQNPFNTPITVFHHNILDFKTEQLFDAIICNPPYFEGSLKNDNQHKAMARHTDVLPFDQLFFKISSLLTKDGSAWFILPLTAIPNCELIWKNFELHVIKRIFIHGKPNKPVRMIVCISKIKKTIQESTFTIRNSNNSYSDAYKELTREFHNRPL